MRELSPEEVNQVGTSPTPARLVPPVTNIENAALRSIFPNVPATSGSLFVPVAPFGGNAA